MLICMWACKRTSCQCLSNNGKFWEMKWQRQQKRLMIAQTNAPFLTLTWTPWHLPTGSLVNMAHTAPNHTLKLDMCNGTLLRIDKWLNTLCIQHLQKDSFSSCDFRIRHFCKWSIFPTIQKLPAETVSKCCGWWQISTSLPRCRTICMRLLGMVVLGVEKAAKL